MLGRMAGEPPLQVDMPELVHRADLAQDPALVRVIKKGHQRPGQPVVQGQPGPGRYVARPGRLVFTHREPDHEPGDEPGHEPGREPGREPEHEPDREPEREPY